MANYVKFKQGLKKDFNTTNQPLTNGMIYFVIDENNNGSIYYDTIVDGKKATKNGTVHRVKFSGLPIKITGSVIGTGVISQDGETIEINTSTNHSHGLAHQDFTVKLSNDDTNLKWTRLGNQNGEGFWLKSIRGQSKAPAWFLPDHSAGIAFGGENTKGIISVKYNEPSIRFAGGNGDAPVWYFTITGSNDKSYDLNGIGGHSSDSAKLDHNVTFKIISTADATKGGNGTATNLSGTAVDLYLPASISGFNLIQSTRFQGNADSATVASKAESLRLNPINRQESLNYKINTDNFQGKITYSLASSTTKTGKPPLGDSHVLTFGWDNSGCGAQLAISSNAKPHMVIRGAKADEKGASIWDETWNTVLDSSNYTSYINNYYWADVKVSTSANAKTNPNFFNVTSSGWFFSNISSTGWQNSAHGGGIYMKDNSYVRVYGGKKFAVENTDSDSINTAGGVKASDGFTSDAGTMKIYAENNNEINFGGTNPSTSIYFGYRKKTSKEIPSIFIFGGETGTASIQANAGWFQYTNIGYNYSSNVSAYRLQVNGAAYINGNLTIPNNSKFIGILGDNNSTNASNAGGLTWFNIEGTAGAAVDTNDTPSSAWWYVLRNRHTNTTNNYYTDVAIPFNDSSIYYKIVRNGSVVNSKWVQVLDVNNYTHTLDGRYVLKTGDTMTGNLNFANNKGIHGLMAGGSDYWEIIGTGVDDAGRLKIRVGDSATTDWLDFEFKDWSNTAETPAVYNPMQMTGNKVIVNCRLYAKEWIQFDNYTGLYSPNNNAHLFSNNISTYGQWAIKGSKGKYSGIHLGESTDYMTIMDSGEHKGLYQQGFDWIVYFRKSSNQVGIRTSTLSNYKITCNGDVCVQNGWLRTTGSTGWYSESYGGGWHMTDSKWIRSYNGKPIYTAGGIYSPHGNMFLCAGNEFNFIPDSYNGIVWFNYQSWSRPTPGETTSSLITEYKFGNGRRGLVDKVYANTFVGSLSGTATNAINANNADTTDGVHLEWSGEQAASATDWIAGWTADGKKIKAVRRSALATKNSDVAAKLGQSGNIAIPMTFYWNGQGGQPNWIWGGNDGTNMYVYNPSNFSVSNAGYIRSMGNQEAESGRTAARGGVYTYNMYDQTTNGAPGTHLSVIGFGNGTSGHIEIAGQWVGNSGLWMRGLRDCCDDWYSWNRIWCQGNSVTGAVWNDYAECRQSDCSEPGRVVFEKGDDTLTKTEKRLQHFAGVISDTWGFSQGETDKAKTNIAVAGRVLVYTYQNRNNYKPGDCVCAAPNGTIDIMTREEIIKFPDRIVGTVSCVPDYEEWGGGKNADRDPVKINDRIWIKVK